MNVNNNISALSTLANLNKVQAQGSRTMESLSSGKRINRASDDAAGTAVAARMTSQVKGLNQASRNASDGIAALQTFEGAMSSQTDILQRMRELAVQSSNGTYSDADRGNLDSEFTQLKSEFDRIADKTSFNGNNFMSSTATSKDLVLQISNVKGDVLTVTFTDSDLDTLSAGGLTTGIDTQANATGVLDALDTALDTLSGNRADLGGYMNRLNYTVNNLSNTSVNLTDAKSRIEDQDMAAAMSELTKTDILTQSSVSMLAKANQAPQNILKLLG